MCIRDRINSHHQSWIIINHQHQSTIIINHEQSSSNNHQLSTSTITQHQPSTSIIKKRDTRSCRNRLHQTSWFFSLPHCCDWPTGLTLLVRVLKNMCASESAYSFCVACESVWSASTHTWITQTREWGCWTQSGPTQQFASKNKVMLAFKKKLLPKLLGRKHA